MIDHRLDRINLSRGGHKNPDQGICVMEAASMLAGEKFSDRPKCVSHTIGQFLRTWNDALDDDDRQMLRPYTLRVLGTNASEEIEEQRLYLVLDWLVRISTPMWLRFVGLTNHAESLESLAPIQNANDAGITIDYLNRAEAAAAADTYAAARAADAAGAAARAAAAAATDDAVRAAVAAGATAYAVAYADTCGRDFFDALQQSVFDLLDRMIALKPGIWNPIVQETEMQMQIQMQEEEVQEVGVQQVQILEEVTI